MAKRVHVQRLSDIAFDDACSKLATRSARELLEKLVQKISEASKNANPNFGSNNHIFDDDDDEGTVIKKISADSDDDSDFAKHPDPAIIETLSCLLPKIKHSLENEIPEKIATQYTLETIAPLGILRLRSIELLSSLIKLNETSIHMALSETQIL